MPLSRSGLLVLRPVVTEPASGPIPAYTRPSWPARITAWRREDAGWFTLLDQSGTVLHANDAVRNALDDTAGVILVAPLDILLLIAAQASQSWTVDQFQADAGATALAIKARWPVWYCSGVGFTNLRLRFPAGLLPALPVLLGSRTVQTRDHVAWDRTMAGYQDDADTEETP
jgi:hypothetical protein